MNNKGWVGILILIILLCVVSIGVFGFIVYKNYSYLSSIKLPEIKNQKNIITVANSVVTTFTEPTPEAFIPTDPSTLPPIYLTRPQFILQTQPQEIIPTKPVAEPCYKYKIEAGDLKSNKCYSEEDYDKIQSLYSDYKFELGTIDFIESRIEITCDGSEFFRTSCEDAKDDLSEQKSKIEKLKSQIRQIISRGK